MPNVNVTYAEMQSAARQLQAGEQATEGDLAKLKGLVDNLVAGGYVTDASSRQFEASYTQFNTGRLRQDRVPGGAGEHVAPWPAVGVELGLGGVQDLRDVLELVDENRPWTRDDEAGVAGRCRPCVRAVKVEDGPVELARESGEQGALAYGARAGEDHDGLFAQGAEGRLQGVGEGAAR